MTVKAYARGGRPRMVNYDPGSTTIAAGDVVVIGDLPCVAHVDIPAFTGAVTLDALSVGGGKYDMTADASYPIGTYVFWDPTAGKVTTAAAGNTVPFGWVIGGANDSLSDSAGTAVLVDHEPSLPGSIPYNIGATANDNITNTSAETAFATTAVIPAATLQAGDVITVKAAMLVSAQNSTNTNNYKLKITTAANTFTALVTVGATNLAANGLVIIDADLIFNAVGASGGVTTAAMVYTNAAAGNTSVPTFLTNTAINTNLAVTIEVTDTQSAASTGNVAQMLELNVTRRRK